MTIQFDPNDVMARLDRLSKRSQKMAGVFLRNGSTELPHQLGREPINITVTFEEGTATDYRIERKGRYEIVINAGAAGLATIELEG